VRLRWFIAPPNELDKLITLLKRNFVYGRLSIRTGHNIRILNNNSCVFDHVA